MLADRARAARHNVHLVLENEENQARRLIRDTAGVPLHYTAQWNDDLHHVLHVAASGEAQGYYGDYHGNTAKLARALAEGFVFQGDMMEFRGAPRGEPSAMLPPTAFVAFIQNHDQIGNRAFGERLTAIAPPAAIRAIASVYLLLPQVPMLFMGEEWGAAQPFAFFCDFSGELAAAVRQGRRDEFARFPEFHDESTRDRIPDPQAESTFASVKLDWTNLSLPAHAAWLDFYRHLLRVRRASIVPLLPAMNGYHATAQVIDTGAVSVQWRAGIAHELHLLANLSDKAIRVRPRNDLNVLWEHGSADEDGRLDPWYVRWSMT